MAKRNKNKKGTRAKRKKEKDLGVEVCSLEQLFHYIAVNSADHDFRKVSVASLCPQTAVTMLNVVTIAPRIVCAGRRWVITNYDRVHCVRFVVEFLTALEKTVLPVVYTFPVQGTLLSTLKAYKDRISERCSQAGGSFATRTSAIITHVDEFLTKVKKELDDYHCNDIPPETMTELRKMVVGLMDEVKSLVEDPDVTISIQP